MSHRRSLLWCSVWNIALYLYILRRDSRRIIYKYASYSMMVAWWLYDGQGSCGLSIDISISRKWRGKNRRKAIVTKALTIKRVIKFHGDHILSCENVVLSFCGEIPLIKFVEIGSNRRVYWSGGTIQFKTLMVSRKPSNISGTIAWILYNSTAADVDWPLYIPNITLGCICTDGI